MNNKSNSKTTKGAINPLAGGRVPPTVTIYWEDTHRVKAITVRTEDDRRLSVALAALSPEGTLVCMTTPMNGPEYVIKRMTASGSAYVPLSFGIGDELSRRIQRRADAEERKAALARATGGVNFSLADRVHA
jgi:hypothetical protein